MQKAKIIIRRFITVLAVVLVISGLLLAGMVAGSYYSHQQNVESIIDSINKQQEDTKSIASSVPLDTDSSMPEEELQSQGNNSNSGNAGSRLSNDVDFNRLREDSVNYNEELKSVQSSMLVGEESYTYAALDLTQYGIYDNIYGYVSAPSIGMELPIYLGANESNMAYGAAHYCYTSLPIGGESTNTVLAGHTGYVGRWLFDSVKHLNVGDTVEIKTYISSLKYTVKSVMVKYPNESEDIFIERGKDKLTLTTCIYDSEGNYKRCIVICERN